MTLLRREVDVTCMIGLALASYMVLSIVDLAMIAHQPFRNRINLVTVSTMAVQRSLSEAHRVKDGKFGDSGGAYGWVSQFRMSATDGRKGDLSLIVGLSLTLSCTPSQLHPQQPPLLGAPCTPPPPPPWSGYYDIWRPSSATVYIIGGPEICQVEIIVLNGRLSTNRPWR